MTFFNPSICRLIEDQKKYDTVVTRFQDHFIARRNVIFERAKFNSRIQEEGESADSFITSLYGLAEHCGLGTLHDKLIRNGFVVGIRDTTESIREATNGSQIQFTESR